MAQPGAAGGLGTRFAPSFSLIRAHFAFGLLGLVALSVGLIAHAGGLEGHFFQPHLLGLVHACVLGWLLPTAFGAMHQLVPVVFEVPVRSERVAWASFGLYVASVVVFVTQMWRLDVGPTLAIAGTGAAVAIWLYLLNLAITLLKSTVRSVTGAYVVSAFVYLALAVVIGALLAWNLASPYLPQNHLDVLRAHAHVAALGFFGFLVMGVGYRLMEMFLLSHGARERAGWVALYATHVAVIALAVGFWFVQLRPLVWLGIAAAAVGGTAFLVQVRLIWIRRMRKKALREAAWRHSLLSFGYFGLTILIGLTLALLPAGEALDRLTLSYGLIFFLGFLGAIVIGQLYKILPFLVWLHRFSRLVGLMKVPAASEMLGERPKQIQLALMHLGLLALVVGVLADVAPVRLIGALLFAGSTVMVVVNLGIINARKP